ncbi:MAG: RND family transporter [Chlorobi bacterium]|nr:RND family transporter [Chlorobiota bacterium]
MENLAEKMVKYRWHVLAAVAVITAFFIYELRYVQVDSNLINSLPKNDPVVKLFNEVGAKFGGNEMGMIILEADNVLEPAVLKDIENITDTLAETDGILSVTSLTNMMTINVEDDDFEVKNLINDDNRPQNKQQAEKLKDEVAGNKMVSGSIISKDATATMILYTIKDGADVDSVSTVVMDKINRMHIKTKYYFAGAPFLRKYIDEIVSNDLRTLIPIAFIVIALILYLSFHSVRGIILPLLTAGLSIIWALGIFTMMGLKLSMVSNNVPIIILAVGSAYAIHVLNRVNQCEVKDKDKKISTAFMFMVVPVSLTALTTMVGFLSFVFGAYLNMIRDFGIFAALGTFFSAVLALTLVPAMLAVLPAKTRRETKNQIDPEKAKMKRFFLVPLSKRVVNHPGRIVLVWSLLFAVSIYGVFILKRSVSTTGYFKKDHPSTIAENIMSEKLGGSKPVFVVFNGDMQSPEVLKAMYDTEKFMVSTPFISGAQSLADVVANLYGAFNDGDARIPDSEDMIGQLWFILGQNESLNRLVTPELDQGIIIAKYVDNGKNNVKDFEKLMNDYLKKHKSKDFTVQITGMPFVNARLDHNLLYSQIFSLLIAIVFVIAIVSLMFRSFIKGLIATAPIIATIGILYGLMGIVGIPLDIVTVLVASIAIGIGIDYSIHFMSHFNHSVKRLNSIKGAIEETILISGRAIMINFISVSAGFLVLVFSDLVAMVYFGILIALSMLGSSMGALTLLPSIFLLESKKQQEKLKR